MELEFSGEIWHWRGPSPYHFVSLPPSDAAAIAEVAAGVSYGWGVVPVVACVGVTEFTTSLIPREGGYLLPLKDAVRKSENLELGDVVEVCLKVDLTPRRR